MTSIKDLQERINSAEKIFNVFKSELDELKAELEALKEQEKDKEQESLFGRWATHPEYGRGIIGSGKPDKTGEVRFAYRNDIFTDGAEWFFVRIESLTLDPVTLTTVNDFNDAPEGTIVEATTGHRDLYVKAGARWRMAVGTIASKGEYVMPCRVIRWGNGQ